MKNRMVEPIRCLSTRSFDIPFVANLALREKQIQQNYRPIIAVHKWFARRPGTLFRSLLLAEFAEPPFTRGIVSNT
jgi:putative DNA methylase